jgi:type IX secretion system PorP/SprF family membrane protein
MTAMVMIMNKRIYLLTVIWLGFTLSSIAQQDPLFTQYMFNTLSVNPAYAGSADMLTANAIYRKQWVNFDGAPTTQTVTLHSPLRNESVSIGGTIVNDSHGPVRQTGVYADVSYRIFFGKSKLAFGLKGGLNLFQANLVDLNPLQEDDPAFAANISNKSLPNFGFGILWYSERFMVGLSAPKLLSNKLIDGELPDFNNNTEKQHFFFIAGYVWDLNPYLKFKPTIMLKGVDGAPPGADVTANFLLYDKFWIGAMYRWEDAVGALLQYEINNKFRIGYSYDYTLSDIGDYSTGSHEIMLGFDLYKPITGDKSPRYF